MELSLLDVPFLLVDATIVFLVIGIAVIIYKGCRGE